MKINSKISWWNCLAILALLLGGTLLGGCGNDPVAPHEEAPALTAADVAAQAGHVAKATRIIGPQTVEFVSKSGANPYVRDFFGDIAGSIYLNFTSDGGNPSLPIEADHVDLYTEADAPLVITVGVEGFEGFVELGFELTADLNRFVVPNVATINGGGTFVSGPYPATFSFDELVVVGGALYPQSGTMTFTGSGFTATITFDGTGFALLTMPGGLNYVVNLMTGKVDDMIDS